MTYKNRQHENTQNPHDMLPLLHHAQLLIMLYVTVDAGW